MQEKITETNLGSLKPKKWRDVRKNVMKKTQKAQAELDTIKENGDKHYILPSGLELIIKDEATSEVISLLERERKQANFLHEKLTAKMDEIEKTHKKEITSLIKFPDGYKKNRYNYNGSSDSYFYSLENFIEDLRILLQFYQKGPDKIVKSLEIFGDGEIKVKYQDVKTNF